MNSLESLGYIIQFLSEKVCDISVNGLDPDPILPLGSNSNQFHLHLFVPSLIQWDTVAEYLRFINEKRYYLAFTYKKCKDIDLNREVDVLGKCDTRIQSSLQQGMWVKLHITTQRLANIGEFAVFKRNDHCPYGDDVQCFKLQISEIASELRLKVHFASVNCISGKTFL